MLIAGLDSYGQRRPVSFASLTQAIVKSGRIFVATAIYQVFCSVGLVFGLLPGVLLSLLWSLYGPYIVLGNYGIVSAFGMSTKVAKERWPLLIQYLSAPYIFYGAVYAAAILPWLLQLKMADLSAGAWPTWSSPVWFYWLAEPLALAAARLYLFSALVCLYRHTSTANLRLGSESLHSGEVN